jgi:hypothetical protein
MAPSLIDPPPASDDMDWATANHGQDEKPIPREPMSPARLAQIQAQNRRLGYLERNPSYFDDPEHELAGK